MKGMVGKLSRQSDPIEVKETGKNRDAKCLQDIWRLSVADHDEKRKAVNNYSVATMNYYLCIQGQKYRALHGYC